MSTQLPPAIAGFFQAHNTGQTQDFDDLFTRDAHVNDEQHEYRGADIKRWMDGAIARYKPHAETTDLARVGEETIVTAQVTGAFPGSPIQIRYRFVLRDDQIAALTIGT